MKFIILGCTAKVWLTWDSYLCLHSLDPGLLFLDAVHRWSCINKQLYFAVISFLLFGDTEVEFECEQ